MSRECFLKKVRKFKGRKWNLYRIINMDFVFMTNEVVLRRVLKEYFKNDKSANMDGITGDMIRNVSGIVIDWL